MHHYFQKLALASVLLLGSACGGKISDADRLAIAEIKKSREFKKIKEADIIAEAAQRGRSIGQHLERQLSAARQAQDSSSSIALHHIVLLGDTALVDSLSQHYAADILFYGSESTGTTPNPLEKKLMEAYRYNHEQGLEMRDNVQKMNDSTMLYTQPLVISEIPEKDGPSSDFSANDGIMKGDRTRFLGMLSVRISRKEIIRFL